jgi:hypothetical protein
MDKFGSVVEIMHRKLRSKFLNSLRIKTQLLFGNQDPDPTGSSV